MIGFCIPTIPARADMLDECVRSLPWNGGKIPFIEHRSASCGEGWQLAGASAFAANQEFICLLGDDVLWRGGSLDCILALKHKILPAPFLLAADDTPSLATPYMGDPQDGREVQNVPFPFLNRELWEAVQPIPPFNHYCDNWITERAIAAGYTPRLVAGYKLVHRVVSADRPGEAEEYAAWKAQHG